MDSNSAASKKENVACPQCHCTGAIGRHHGPDGIGSMRCTHDFHKLAAQSAAPVPQTPDLAKLAQEFCEVECTPQNEIADELIAARTAWLGHHGVPISPEFVRFANAIGDAVNALRAGLPSEQEEGWVKVEDKEPPHGLVLQVVIDGVVQHMPAIWDGEEWTWLDAADEDEPVPKDKITDYRRLPAPPERSSDENEENEAARS